MNWEEQPLPRRTLLAPTGIDPTFKFGARLAHGEDLRDRLPVVPIEAWTRDRTHTSYWRIASLFRRPRVVSRPLGYPDPDGAFYGYDRRTLRLPDGSEAHGTRDLIRLTGWAATGLVALQAGRYVSRESDCHVLHRACIVDEWSTPLEGDRMAMCYPTRREGDNMTKEFTVVIERDEEGYVVASVPSLPGCHTQARSTDELLERVKEAIEMCPEAEGKESEEPLELVDLTRDELIAMLREQRPSSD